MEYSKRSDTYPTKKLKRNYSAIEEDSIIIESSSDKNYKSSNKSHLAKIQETGGSSSRLGKLKSNLIYERNKGQQQNDGLGYTCTCGKFCSNYEGFSAHLRTKHQANPLHHSSKKEIIAASTNSQTHSKSSNAPTIGGLSGSGMKLKQETALKGSDLKLKLFEQKEVTLLYKSTPDPGKNQREKNPCKITLNETFKPNLVIFMNFLSSINGRVISVNKVSRRTARRDRVCQHNDKTKANLC